jgi:prefoldin subunit 5
MMPEDDTKQQMHATDDALELYALNKLVGLDLDSLEEHLLVCQACRSSLDIIDQEIKALRQSLQEFQLEDRIRSVQSRVNTGKLVLFKASS